VSGPAERRDAEGRPVGPQVPASPVTVVVLGTGPFAVPMLRAIIASPHRVLAVVTRPDRVAPGRRPPRNPVREAAEAAGIPVLAPDSVNAPESTAALRTIGADLFVVCDYGQILSADVLAIPRLGGINLHGSLLPRHRGAAPVQWAILSGDATTGACVIHMTPALDAGRVLATAETPIGPHETAAELEPRLAELGVPLVIHAIGLLVAATDPLDVGEPQDPALVTRAPRLSKSDSLVDWSRPAVAIERRWRAMEPWPRTTSFLLREGAAPVRIVLEQVTVAEGRRSDAAPGTVVEADDSGMFVACGDGTVLVIVKVVPEGRRSMTSAEFLRGTLVAKGQRFGSVPHGSAGR